MISYYEYFENPGNFFPKEGDKKSLAKSTPPTEAEMRKCRKRISELSEKLSRETLASQGLVDLDGIILLHPDKEFFGAA